MNSMLFEVKDSIFIHDFQNFFSVESMQKFLPNILFNSFYFFVIFMILFFFHRILNHKFETNKIINKNLLNKIFSPINWLIIFLFLISNIEIILEFLPSLKQSTDSFIKNTPIIKRILIIIFIGLSCFYFIKYFQRNYISKWREECEVAKISGTAIKNIDISKIDLISKISTIILFFIISLTILSSFGINLSGLIAIGGASGLIVGFATKDLLSNFFGLFSVYLDRPFSIGEYINIVEKSISGTIEEIGLRTTKIRTDNETLIYLPNSIFNTLIIENISRLKYRVFKHEIKIKNDTNIDSEKRDHLISSLKKSINELEFVETINITNQRIFISIINDDFVEIKFIVNLSPTSKIIFEQNSHRLLNKIYEILKKENFEIIPYLTDVVLNNVKK
jgi:MscS family membrane protein